MALALQHAAFDLQSWFLPLFETHREYSRATEILCQLDDLSDYTDQVESSRTSTIHPSVAHDNPDDSTC
jgi:hypothetical protein